MSVSGVIAALLLAGAPPVALSAIPAARSPEPSVAPAPTVPAAQREPAALEPSPAPAEPASPMQPAALAPSPGTDPGVIVVTARRRPVPGDPLEAINITSFAVTQSVDKAFVGPIAMAYKHDLPGPIRSGLRNLLRNLHEPAVFLSFLLELKPGKAAETLGRFALNSTLGGAGLFDVAKRRPFNLPYRPNGFADAMGYHGVKPGPFFFLPLIGPTTLRDFIGDALDRLVLPLAVGRPFNKPGYTIPASVIRSLDHRAEFDAQLHALHDGNAHPYSASRDDYLRWRQAEIDALHNRRSAVGPSAAPSPAKPDRAGQSQP